MRICVYFRVLVYSKGVEFGMNIAYYIEINLVCIIILLLLRHQTKAGTDHETREKKLFGAMIWATVIFCAADIAAGACRGELFEGARTINQISNIVYFEMIVVISWFWMQYVFVKIRLSFSRKINIVMSLPLLLFTAAAISNPFTHILFLLDENDLYHRNYGVFINWIVAWLYLLLPMIAVIYTAAHETSKAKRREITPFLYFIIAPAIASVIQMIFYGMSTTQVGITISIVMVFLAVQGGKAGQITMDVLTGLNNRRGLNNYLDYYTQSHAGSELTVIMIDLDRFKQVNDEFGHIAGDRALRYMSEALKKACGSISGRPYLCRYGGDEFVIAGADQLPEETEKLKAAVYEEIDEAMRGCDEPFTLSASIGIAAGMCSDMEDAERIIKLADEEMYKDKKRLVFK